MPFSVFQDNTSTITIAYMGRSSSHAKRRFIEIRYFWFKEHLDGGFAKLDYLRSEDHPADLLAGVRSGAEFKHFTNLIMGSISNFHLPWNSHENLERVGFYDVNLSYCVAHMITVIFSNYRPLQFCRIDFVI